MGGCQCGHLGGGGCYHQRWGMLMGNAQAAAGRRVRFESFTFAGIVLSSRLGQLQFGVGGLAFLACRLVGRSTGVTILLAGAIGSAS